MKTEMLTGKLIVQFDPHLFVSQVCKMEFGLETSFYDDKNTETLLLTLFFAYELSFFCFKEKIRTHGQTVQTKVVTLLQV